MYHVDRLNRKYDQLTSGVEDENLGPLEATIKNLGKSIQQTERSNTELQRQWIRDQVYNLFLSFSIFFNLFLSSFPSPKR